MGCVRRKRTPRLSGVRRGQRIEVGRSRLSLARRFRRRRLKNCSYLRTTVPAARQAVAPHWRWLDRPPPASMLDRVSAARALSPRCAILVGLIGCSSDELGARPRASRRRSPRAAPTRWPGQASTSIRRSPAARQAARWRAAGPRRRRRRYGPARQAPDGRLAGRRGRSPRAPAPRPPGPRRPGRTAAAGRLPRARPRLRQLLGRRRPARPRPTAPGCAASRAGSARAARP